MANKVRKSKIERVRKDLAEGKSYREAMTNNGYTEKTANKGINNKVIQEALSKNRVEFLKEGVTTKEVILNLRENRELAKQKGDIASMNRADELLGKTIALYTDKIDQTTQELTPKLEEAMRNYKHSNRFDDN